MRFVARVHGNAVFRRLQRLERQRRQRFHVRQGHIENFDLGLVLLFPARLLDVHIYSDLIEHEKNVSKSRALAPSLSKIDQLPGCPGGSAPNAMSVPECAICLRGLIAKCRNHSFGYSISIRSLRVNFDLTYVGG